MSETELFLRANDRQANPETQVIIKFMRYPGLILAYVEHWRGIDTNYVVPFIEVILDEKNTKLKYNSPISIDKQEGVAEAIHNYLTRHIHSMPACNKDTIYHFDFGYAIVLDFYNHTLKDFLAHDLVDLTLARKVLKI